MAERDERISRRAMLRLLAGASASAALFSVTGCQPEIGEIPVPVNPTVKATMPPPPTATATTAPTATPQPTVNPDPNVGIFFTQAGDPNEQKIALTIDDFYQEDVIFYWMPKYLANNPDVKLTMFPVGPQIRRVEEMFPGIWADWLAAGHELGWHSINHADFGQLTAADLREDIDAFTAICREVLADPTFTLRWARAPYGNYWPNIENFEVVAKDYGLTWVLWGPIPSHAKADPLEWPNSIENGDISLFHVRWQDQYWLERYVGFVRERGFEMVTLSEMKLTVDDKLTATTTGY